MHISPGTDWILRTSTPITIKTHTNGHVEPPVIFERIYTQTTGATVHKDSWRGDVGGLPNMDVPVPRLTQTPTLTLPAPTYCGAQPRSHLRIFCTYSYPPLLVMLVIFCILTNGPEMQTTNTSERYMYIYTTLVKTKHDRQIWINLQHEHRIRRL